MKLVNAARYADDTQLYDAYTGAKWELGQISTYIDSNVDGTISQRRVLSMSPTIDILARRVVSYGGENWLLGDTTVDMYRGKPIRQSVAAKKVTDLFEILTPGQACLGTSGVQAYGQRIYRKETTNALTDSPYDAYYDVYFSQSEPLVRSKLLKLGTTYYLARGVYTLLEGFFCAAADELDAGALVSAVFTGETTYNATTDSYTGSPVTTGALLLDMYMLYQFTSQADPRNQAGDRTLLVATSAVTPLAGQTVVIAGESWRILRVLPEQDAWKLHVRLA